MYQINPNHQISKLRRKQRGENYAVASETHYKNQHGALLFQGAGAQQSLIEHRHTLPSLGLWLEKPSRLT